MKQPWWVEDRAELGMQIGLLAIEVMVSAGIALTTTLLIPLLVGWDAPMTPQLMTVFVIWVVSAFVITLAFFVRAHLRSLR